MFLSLGLSGKDETEIIPPTTFHTYRIPQVHWRQGNPSRWFNVQSTRKTPKLENLIKKQIPVALQVA